MFFLLAIFLELHGPNGQIIEVNPNEISSLRTPQAGSSEHFAKGVRCIIKMTNSNINAVVETCETVLFMLKEGK
jgi:hypothetical protein